MEWSVWYFLCSASWVLIPLANFSLAVAARYRVVSPWWPLPQRHRCLLLNPGAASWSSFHLLDACADLDPSGMGGGASMPSLSIAWLDDPKAPLRAPLELSFVGGDLLPTVQVCSVGHLCVGFLCCISLLQVPHSCSLGSLPKINCHLTSSAGLWFCSLQVTLGWEHGSNKSSPSILDVCSWYLLYPLQ